MVPECHGDLTGCLNSELSCRIDPCPETLLSRPSGPASQARYRDMAPGRLGFRNVFRFPDATWPRNALLAG